MGPIICIIMLLHQLRKIILHGDWPPKLKFKLNSPIEKYICNLYQMNKKNNAYKYLRHFDAFSEPSEESISRRRLKARMRATWTASNNVFGTGQLSDPTKSSSPNGLKNNWIPNERRKLYTEKRCATYSSGTPIFPEDGGNCGGRISGASTS